MKFLKACATSPVVAALLFVLGCALIAQGPGMAQVWIWSQTAGTNASIDPTINWAAGNAPSAVNASARQMMARIAQARDDWSGANPTGGTASAYTLTSNQHFDTLAHMDNAQICFTPSATNAVNATLAVDGLAAAAIDSAPSTPVGAGVLIQGTPYCVVYDNSGPAFYLREFYGQPFAVPLGAMIDYTASTAPNSNFVFPFGQAISRTTYAAYFALVSTQYGSGDGVTTFNVPDLRGRVAAALDNMGGTPASRMTSAACGGSFTALGSTCGVQTRTIAQSQLPNYNLSVSDPGHTHGLNANLVGASATSITFGGGSGPITVPSSAVGQTVNAAQTGISVNSGGGNGAFPIVQPSFGINKILRVF